MSKYDEVHHHFSFIEKKLTKMLLQHTRGELKHIHKDLSDLQDLSEKWADMYEPEEEKD